MTRGPELGGPDFGDVPPPDFEPLDALFDVKGVYGCFILDSNGLVLRAQVPEVLTCSHLQIAGIRIARLWAALPPGESRVSQELRFNAHCLHVRRWSAGSICVLASPHCSQRALQTAASVVASLLEQDRVAAVTPATPRRRITIYRGVRYLA